ncbi:hypothetical protein CPB83DRAFT_857730 [Crepidotus variabilis]|uniref:MYND-type domain-containing protein n=1 Tax=Crepidotus variabilis TaxID=179855 RepID=A0A9P6EBU4_9AGAR|nr:hypothetical protein CPB83DRAFT_857730 [Crepidotus variabilis]
MTSKETEDLRKFPDCAMCNSPATIRCPKCCCVNLYCSVKCQRADANVHNLLCSKRRTFETPPSTSARRAIVFYENGDIKFVWINTEMKTDPDEGTWESPVGLKRYFYGKNPSLQAYYSNVVRSRRLKEQIDLRLKDDFLLDGTSKKNLAVCKVVPIMNNGGTVWRGPLVALKHERSWHNEERSWPNACPGYGHMDMGDFREVVDYLTNWKRGIDGVYETPRNYSRKSSVFFGLITVSMIFGVLYKIFL